MKQTIVPRFIEDKTSKAGKRYWQIEDNDRYLYSVFDDIVIEHIQKNIGKPCDVEVMDSKDGNFKNIRAFYAAGPGAEARMPSIKEAPGDIGFQMSTIKPERVVTKPVTKYMGNCTDSKSNEKLASILVSYAKDMWIAANLEDTTALEAITEDVIKAYKLALEKL